MANHTLKEFEEVSKVSNTSLNARIFGMVVSFLLAAASLILTNLATILNSFVPRPLSEARD